MHTATGTAPPPVSSPVAVAGLVSLALLGGAAVALLSVLGAGPQTAIVLGLIVGLPGTLLFLARPHVAVAAYLLLLALIPDEPVLGDVNGGEILTAGMVLLLGFALWQAGARLRLAARSLAPLVWPLVGLAAVSVVSLLANGIGSFAEIASSVFKFAAFGAVAVMVHAYADTPGRVKAMLYGALAGAFLVAVYAAIAYLMGWSYSELHDWNRASGTFAHWNQLGGFMVLMSLATLGAAAATRRITLRLALALAFVLEIVALLLSLTLGSIVALAAAALFGSVFVARIGWARILAIGVLAAVGFGVVYATNPTFQEKLTRFPERTEDRLRTYAVGVAMFSDRALLGFGSQENLLDELWFGEAGYGLTAMGAASSVPHNAFLLVGVEKGVLGVFFFTLLIGGALWILFRSRHTLLTGRFALLYQGITVGTAGFLVQNMTNNLVLHARIGIIFFALIALVDRMARLSEEEEEA